MKTIFHPLLVLLANLTDQTLARQLKDVVRQLQFVKAENEVLRAHLPERVVVTSQERRRLVRLGKPLGSAIRDLVTIVTPASFLRWIREAKADREPGKAGRRRRINVRKLIIKLARENPGWGYTRVLGELRKLTRQKGLPPVRGQRHARAQLRSRTLARREDLGRVPQDARGHPLAM